MRMREAKSGATPVRWTAHGRAGSSDVVVEWGGKAASIMSVPEFVDALRGGERPADAETTEEISPASLETAERRLKIVLDLRELRWRTRADVEAAAEKAGVSASTVYDWLKAYEARESVEDLLPSKRGPKRGSTRLAREVEAAVEAEVEALLKAGNPIRIGEALRAVEDACRANGVSTPSPNTVRNRIERLAAKLDPHGTCIRGNRKRAARRDG